MQDMWYDYFDTNLNRYVSNNITNFIDPSGYIEVLTPPPVTTPIPPVVTNRGAEVLGKVLGFGAAASRVGIGTAAIYSLFLIFPEKAADGTLRRNRKPTPLPQPSPSPSTTPRPYGPPEGPIPIERMTDREIERMLDKRLRDIQNQGPKYKNPPQIHITTTVEKQYDAQREPESPDPNCDEEKKKRCKSGIFKDFAHGAPIVDINNILANGIKLSEANARKRGGLVNRQGFYTIELTEQDGTDANQKINTAYQFGYNRGNPVGVLIFKLCKEVYNELASKGQILKRQIAGVPEHNETIFLPESFNTLNKEK